jgi:tetratricopeptide (TPR) repeat protein
MALRPLCFVLMPFGKKPDSTGDLVDFDGVYDQIIKPAVENAGMEPIRADEEQVGGIIHKAMFERLILCEYAVADLTTANANVFYELGVRHAVRPWSTVLLFAEQTRLPFDVEMLRALKYRLTEAGEPDAVQHTRQELSERLQQVRTLAANDSPVYQLVENFPDVDHTKTDVFRERVDYARAIKDRLAEARRHGVEAIRQVERELGAPEELESGVLVDLFLSYRAASAWKDMIDLVRKMPRPLAESVLVREQYALALNRAGESEKAERVLRELLERRGPSSETYGLLGRVYKDRWEAALKGGRTIEARGLLTKAIDAYRNGFETDWRDAYPGVNAVTLMELKEPPDPARLNLIPVVSYAVRRRVEGGTPDYWDHATLLELAVLAKDEEGASRALADALAAVREPWEAETTARNLKLIREARAGRGERVAWAADVEEALRRKAGI